MFNHEGIIMRFRHIIFLSALTFAFQSLMADNQTSTVSAVGSQDSLPFTISIDTAPFNLPAGIHSGVVASWEGKWLFLAGRSNGMHGFAADPFPPSMQNTTAYVVDYANQIVYSRDLDDASSGLTQDQIDTLSVTSPQYFQRGETLYITGGYGVETSSGDFGTKPVLTAIDIPNFISWVIDSSSADPAAASVRQTINPWVQVTGGYMTCLDNHLTGLLIFGQNFTGVYTPSSNGDYTQQVRKFQIIDNGTDLYVQQRDSEAPNASYRRRDLNVVPIMKQNQQAFVALSGVFTLTTGIWTVPVEIERDGSTFMADPNDPDTFKQAMNNYTSAFATLYSPSEDVNYTVLLGGITFGYFDGNTFETSSDFPFTNQVTTVRRDGAGVYSQFFMDEQYPVILSTGSNPGNELLFGAGASFIKAQGLPLYPNGVINFDKITTPTVIGYVVGGIMSTVPNTSSQTDSTASPYIFPVTVIPTSD